MAEVARGFIAVAFVTELLIPDIRLELGADDPGWALSWPIVFTSVKVVRGDSVGIGLQPFVEPQYRTTREAFRLLGGGRAILFQRDPEFQLAPLVEAGGLFGQDGSGWFAGGGLVLGAPEIGVTFGLVGRMIETGEERRYDLALDFQMPLTSDEY